MRQHSNIITVDRGVCATFAVAIPITIIMTLTVINIVIHKRQAKLWPSQASRQRRGLY